MSLAKKLDKKWKAGLPKAKVKDLGDEQYAATCPECGNKFEIACPSCNQVNPLGSKYCNECGHSLTQPSEPAPKDLSFDKLPRVL